MIKLNCDNCHAQLEVDVDNLQAYCPYCGQKLLIDVEHLDEILTEKEKTKRLQMEYDYKERKEEKDNAILDKGLALYFRLLFVVLGLFLGLSFLGKAKENYTHKAKNEIKVAVSAIELKGANYKNVKKILESAGFDNIEFIKNEDLIFGWFAEDGEVESVTINGYSDFYEGDWFPADADIKITYHTYKEK